MKKITLFLLLTLPGACATTQPVDRDLDGRAHACAMDVEDNFQEYTYTNQAEFDAQVAICILTGRVTQ